MGARRERLIIRTDAVGDPQLTQFLAKRLFSGRRRLLTALAATRARLSAQCRERNGAPSAGRWQLENEWPYRLDSRAESRSSPARATFGNRNHGCPPATDCELCRRRAGTDVLVGGQDCHALTSGAYTGDISAEMLKDAGAVPLIVGHSERRQYHGETDAAVRAKVLGAGRAGLVGIVCVGETRARTRRWAGA